MGRPCGQYSFDYDFKLDSSFSQSGIDENWSPIFNGKAPISIDNRVSPVKAPTGLLGGVFPVQMGKKKTNQV